MFLWKKSPPNHQNRWTGSAQILVKFHKDDKTWTLGQQKCSNSFWHRLPVFWPSHRSVSWCGAHPPVTWTACLQVPHLMISCLSSSHSLIQTVVTERAFRPKVRVPITVLWGLREVWPWVGPRGWVWGALHWPFTVRGQTLRLGLWYSGTVSLYPLAWEHLHNHVHQRYAKRTQPCRTVYKLLSIAE